MPGDACEARVNPYFIVFDGLIPALEAWDTPDTSCRRHLVLSSWDWPVAPVVIETTLCLPAEPAGFDIFHK